MQDITPSLKDKVLKDICDRYNSSNGNPLTFSRSEMNYQLSPAFFMMVMRDFGDRGFIKLSSGKSSITVEPTLSGYEFSRDWGFEAERERRILDLKQLLKDLDNIDESSPKTTIIKKINDAVSIIRLFINTGCTADHIFR